MLLSILTLVAVGCAAPLPSSAAPSPPSADAGGRGAVSSVSPGGPQVSPGAKNEAASTAVGDRLIIKTGTLTLIVKSVQEGIGTVTNIATGAGGYVLSSNARYEAEKLVATVSIKVPVTGFESCLEKMRQMAVEVRSENTGGQDVTEEYADLEAQVRNLQATEKQLLNLLDRAQTVEDTLKVYDQLTNIRGQIERINGRMSYLQKSAAMSTITATLRPVEEKPVVKTGKEAWAPLDTLRDAGRTFLSLLQVLGDLSIWLVVFSPFVLVPAFFLWLLWRWTHRRGKGVK